MPDAPDPDYDPNSATIPLSGPRPTLSGSNVDLPLPEELAKLLPAGAYEISGFLGAGGMGAVYKGMQIRLKRPVAIKIMRRDMGKDHDFEARFEREAQAMAKLNHPNIISVIDFGEAGPDYLFIVMELVDGTDLMDVIRSKQMTQEMALTLLPQICDALQFAHDHGIVHRDIKPSNIMLSRDGRVKMADFGLAKHFDHAESGFRTQTGTGMGTPDYAAPEQFDPTTPVDHRADIYALGVMIYQMITGALPRGVWRPPSQRAPVSTHWDAVVSRAMQNDPAERYQKASEVKTELSSIPLAGSKTDTPVRLSTTSGAAAKPKEAERSLRAPLLFGLIVGAVVIAIGAFFVLKKPAQSGPLTPASGTSNAKALGAPPQVVTALKQAATASPSPKLPVTKAPIAAPPLPESGWKPVITDWVKIKAQKGVTVLGDGWMQLDHAWIHGPDKRDVAIRVRLRFDGTQVWPLKVRERNPPGEFYSASLQADGTTLVLAKQADGKSGKQTIGSAALPTPIQKGGEYEIALAAQGEEITAYLNGRPLIQVRDSSVQGTVASFGEIEPISGIKDLQWLALAPPKAVESDAPSPSLPISKASDPKFPPGQWVKLFTKPEDLPADLRKTDSGVKWEDGWIRVTPTTRPIGLPDELRGNYAVRLHAVRAEARTDMALRWQKSSNVADKGLYSIQLHSGSLQLKRMEQEKYFDMHSSRLAEPPAPGTEYALEYGVVGDRVVGRVSKNPAIVIRDARWVRGPGYLSATEDLRDIEVINLDGLPEAEALRLLGVDEQGKDLRGKTAVNTGSTSTTPTPGWRNALAEAPLKGVIATADHTDKGYLLPPGNHWEFPAQPVRAGAIRVLAVTEAGSPNHLSLNFGLPGTKDHYQVFFRRKLNECGLGYLKEGLPERRLALKKGVHVADGEPHELLLARIADQFYFLLNGEVILQAAEPDATARYLTLNCFGDTRARVQKVEYLNLDGVSEAEALKAAGIVTASPSFPISSSSSATKDAPFINTLGMKFVPVPITGGPTDKQRVLFSVWETRVQDYEAFVKETKREWPKPNFEQGPTHPAVKVTWEDAQAFCAWLTAKEQRAGKVTADEVYRLPSDHEWSCAVGIGDREDPKHTPVKKSNLPLPGYPWGGEWPPPAGAGNLAGEELQAEFASGRYLFIKAVISGFRDGYPTTAPTGSFAADDAGLFDLAGNVRELCGDWINPIQDKRVTRGSSWVWGDDKKVLGVSQRIGHEPRLYDEDLGFRIVLTSAPSTASVSTSPNLPVSASSAQFPPGQWVKLFTKPEDLPADLRKPDSGVTWEDGWIRCAVGKPRRIYVVESLSNYAIRATMLRQGTEYQNKALIIRAAPPPSDAGYRLALADTFYARRAEDGSPSDVFLWNVPVPVVHRPRIGEEYTLEWGCVGDKLIGRLGKDFVKVVADTTMSSGQGFFTGGEPIRDIEVINLDGLLEAEALRLLGVDEQGNDLRGKTSTSTSAVPWQDALKDRAFTQSNGNCVIGPDGFRSRIDYIWHLRDGTPRDGAIRIVTAYEGPLSPKLIARADTGSKNHYQVNIEPGGSSISLVRKEDTAYFKVANAPVTPAIRSGDQVDLELHAVGPELSVKLNGTAIVQATDTTLPTGEFGIWALAKTQAPVRSLQFLPLTDSTSQSPSLLVSSSPTSATQATPFINTLGMKFVPVPITGGPTDKQRVLFSVWETRAQDYEAYAKETKRERPKPDFEQGPGHPAVNVTWDEAVAFCAWLTERERKAGKITPNEAYRLPSDHEWSCAAGLGEREDASKTPTEKDAVIADLFLWGSTWPPPAQAGNYWSEELTSPPTPIKMPSDVREPLVGRRDGFAATAPVGSFPATPSGLHDLGGNVLEWCADWMDAAKSLRVLRGGSWASPSREHLLVSNRSRGIQNVRTTDLGFRCVLAPAP